MFFANRIIAQVANAFDDADTGVSDQVVECVMYAVRGRHYPATRDHRSAAKLTINGRKITRANQRYNRGPLFDSSRSATDDARREFVHNRVDIEGRAIGIVVCASRTRGQTRCNHQTGGGQENRHGGARASLHTPPDM